MMGAEVPVSDPHIEEASCLDVSVARRCTPEELASADIVVLLADHDEFDFDDIVGHAKFILDCRHRVKGSHVEYL